MVSLSSSINSKTTIIFKLSWINLLSSSNFPFLKDNVSIFNKSYFPAITLSDSKSILFIG